MELRKRMAGSVVVVSLTGDLDSRAAPAAQERLTALASQDGRMLVDLTGVPYMSSAGLRTMLLLYRQAQCVNNKVALVGLSEDLRALMAATGFLDFFVVRDSVVAGLDALGSNEQERSDEPVPGA